MVLSQLSRKQTARVLSLPKDSHNRLLLAEQGIVPECRLTLLNKALFNGPIAVELDNTRLALPKALASQIQVELC